MCTDVSIGVHARAHTDKHARTGIVGFDNINIAIALGKCSDCMILFS